jgi:phosphoenolpyruvate carboxykinase (GTP)
MNPRIDALNYQKLEVLDNPKVLKLVNYYVELCKPAKVSVISDSPADIAYVRQLALNLREEKSLNTPGHTVHYDGYKDQARDKKHTKVLLAEGKELSRHINTTERESGLEEIFTLLDGIMEGKELLVRFFCLGPLNSRFSIPALQFTDSAYVAHSEDLLYRTGYQQFIDLKGSSDFFHFIHSAGRLDSRGNSSEIDNRRIYIDLEENRVFTVNNQYAGNSLGLKKLALRLAINKANHSDWLAEHMFIMGVHPANIERTTYFTGAFPSACGKTSTAMIPGQTIIGDDIAYLKIWDDGSCHAVNIESGIFGIIKDVNPIDDPEIFKCLMSPRELIFSNILIHDEHPYWLGMGQSTPSAGVNHSGEWSEGKVDADGNVIPLAHKNARYTIRLSELDNLDPRADDPDGVPIDAIIYGGRDSDTNVPITQSLNWLHGVFIGASLESETTAATLGKEGQRTHSPMANLDFIVVSLGKYIANHIRFGEKLRCQPLIFSTNYFLKGDTGNYLNEKLDKKVWILWAEKRVHKECEAIETPVGFIPKYSDLKQLFAITLDKEYTEQEYIQQFSIRLDKQLAKLERIQKIYADENLPSEIHWLMEDLQQKLEALQKKHGNNTISPLEL